ncbi:MAG: hypothetical protein IPG61_14145 [bacterium]|nr:hypothetical protein [bacterium]MBK7671267.1 hypothetical protein [bacterium]
MRIRKMSPVLTRLLMFMAPIAAASWSVPGSATAIPITVTSIAPGSEDGAIAGMLVESFEDVNLVPGLSITFSVWRNSANQVTANPPVTYTGTLPGVWTASVAGFPSNPWDGTRALVNGNGHMWAYPFAASVELQFDPPRTTVGFGLSNVQTDAGSAFTSHTLWVNGVSQGRLEDLPGWVSTVSNRNRYLLVTFDAIDSIVFTADTHFDGMVVDKLALGEAAGVVPVATTSWGQVKALFR